MASTKNQRNNYGAQLLLQHAIPHNSKFAFYPEIFVIIKYSY